jgi:hypothetical protein
MTIFNKVAGDQVVVSQDISLLREGSHGALSSGNLYTLVGDYVMKYWSHNTAINALTGNFSNTDDSGTCTLIVFTEGLPTVNGNSLWSIYSAPAVGANAAPNFSTTPLYSMNLQTGAATLGSLTVNGSVLSSKLAISSTGTPVGTPNAAGGGTVAAGNNYCKIVAVDSVGGLTVASAESAQVVTTGSTSTIAWQWNPVLGAASYQVWLGTSSGGETHFATSTIPYYVQTLPAASLTSGTINLADGTGQGKFYGTTAGDSVAAGQVGEVITATVASGSAVALTTATGKTVTSIALTAGDWWVNWVGDFIPAATTSITTLACGLGTTTNTLLGQAGGGGIGTDPAVSVAEAANVPGANVIAMAGGPVRVNITTATTIYLVALANFTVSTLSAYGTITAERRR